MQEDTRCTVSVVTAAECLHCVIHCLMDPLLFGQGLESCLKGPDSYNSQVLIEATVIALTKLQPLLTKVHHNQITLDQINTQIMNYL